MNAKPTLDELFERRITYPDFEPQARLARLVGLDDQKNRLAKILGLLEVSQTGRSGTIPARRRSSTLFCAALRWWCSPATWALGRRNSPRRSAMRWRGRKGSTSLFCP